MKKITVLFAFLFCAAMISAQDAPAASKKSCSKTCAKTCGSKSASASVETDTKVASAEKAAEIAAASDESIEKKVCSESGTVSYYKKTTCAHSGATKMTEVKFDAMSNSFVSVEDTSVKSAEKEAEVVKDSGKSKTCAKAGSKSCCASKKKGA